MAAWFQEIGYYKPRKQTYAPDIRTFRDREGNEFCSINIVVGDEEDTYIEGAPIIAYSVLNEYNQNSTMHFYYETKTIG